MDSRQFDSITMNQVVTMVTDALDSFYARDRILFRDDIAHAVSERTMAAKIGFYLEQHGRNSGIIGDLSVDLEYNRNFNDPKSIYSIFHHRRRNVIPDLLIHRRNSNNDNLLVIEFKKGTPPERERRYDEEKLRYFTSSQSEYRFRFGMYIELHTEDAHIDIYRDGQRAHSFNHQ